MSLFKFLATAFVIASVSLSAACSSGPETESVDESTSDLSVASLTISDRGDAEGIRTSVDRIVFPTNARFQNLLVTNRSGFGLELSGNTSPRTFQPVQNRGPEPTVISVGVPGKLKFTAYPGENIWIDLVAGPGPGPGCTTGTTYVLTSAAESLSVDGYGSCYPQIDAGCKSQPGDARLLRVTVDECHLPQSVKARIVGAGTFLYGTGTELFDKSSLYMANGSGFASDLTSRHGGQYGHAELELDSSGHVTSAEVFVTAGDESPIANGGMHYRASTCVPKTCASTKTKCGSIDDQCGGRESCGDCAPEIGSYDKTGYKSKVIVACAARNGGPAAAGDPSRAGGNPWVHPWGSDDHPMGPMVENAVRPKWTGEVQDLEGGSLGPTICMHANGETDAFMVRGAIRDAYFAEGGATSYLGYPLEDERWSGTAPIQHFYGGFITVDAQNHFRAFRNPTCLPSGHYHCTVGAQTADIDLTPLPDGSVINEKTFTAFLCDGSVFYQRRTGSWTKNGNGFSSTRAADGVVASCVR